MKNNHQLRGRNIRISLLIFISVLFAGRVFAQSVSVSGAVSGNGSYPDLASAFTAINSGTQTSANISVLILASTTETTTAVLNAGAWTSLSVTPSSGNYTISGNIAGPLVDLNGADNVRIDGIGGGGNSLTFSNTNTLNLSTSTIRFINDATFNTINQCFVLGASTSVGLGTITYSTGVSLGNSNNTVSNCNIGGVGTSYAVNGIFSSGTASFENKNNSVINNNVFDYFSATLAPSGIFISSNNSNWNISGNKLYQTNSTVYTTANTIKAIQVNSGNGYTVNNNIIGYSNSAGTGTTVMSGAIAVRYIAIELSVGTLTTSSVQGNTISALTLSTTSGATTVNGILCGINILAGNVNVGTTTGNLIGGTSGVGLISCYPTTTGGLFVGINSSSTGSISIANNYIGGCLSTGNTAAVAGAVTAINISGVAAGLSISSNTIGNTTANNLRGGTIALTTGNSLCHGISILSTQTAANIVISNNLIRNFASYGTGTTGALRGIYAGGGTGIAITSNTITNLTTNNSNVSVSTGSIGTAGIQLSGGTSFTVASNLITNIANTGTATTHVIVGGIAMGNVATPVFSGNRIYDIINLSPGTTVTGPPVACGFFIRSGVGTTSITIVNNFVSLGNGQTSNTSFMGVYGNHGSTPNPTVQLYYNTFNIEGTVSSGALPTFGVGRTDFSTVARTAPYVLRNNLISNTRTGGTGTHFAIANNYGAAAASTGSWGPGASDNNILNANPATVGWWTTTLTLAGWQAASACDASSFSGATVTYSNSANNLHINMGTTPNLIESNAVAIPGFSTDIDGQTRPGPIGSVNGGALAPDIGADEFDGVILDVSKPTITYTPLPPSCTTGDRTFTATITDYTGIPTTGSLVPTVYYRKNSNSYVSAPGLLASGNSTNGVWSFTISSSAMGGLVSNDQVSYFVIAQDNVSPTFNIGSNPSAGLVAVNVTSVTSAPTVPNSYLVASMSGTYTIGSSGNFTTITAAANAYNTSCLAGPVTFSLIDALYSTAETFPITFQNNATANATNSLLIKPAASNNATITSSFSTAIIKLNGADYITVDGSNNGSTSQNLTIENTSTASGAGIWIGNASLTDAASNLTIKNSVVTGSTGVTTVAGVLIGSGITFGSASDIPNNNLTFTGNRFMRFQQAFFASGNATTPDANWTFTGNFCGSTIAADKLGFRGILVQNAQSVVISSNTVAGISNTVSANAGMGISAGSNATNYTITNNVLYDLKNANTTAAGGMLALRLTSTNNAANMLVANNMISDVATYGSTTAGATTNGYGIGVLSGGGYKIYNNSVLLNTDQTVSGVQAPMFVASTATVAAGIDLRNNIFASTQTVGVERYAIYSQASSTVFSNVDFNSYSTTGPNLGFIISSVPNFTALQAGFGGNINSNTISPVFTSSVDLHLLSASNASLDNLGTPLSGVTNDIDNQTRSLTTPDMGADEFSGPACSSISAGTIATSSYSTCIGSSITLSSLGSTSGGGVSKQWKVATVATGPYTNVSTGSGFYTPTFNTGTLSSGTLYYILSATCATGPQTAVSNTVTVVASPVPTASAAVNSSMICTGNNLLLLGSSVGGNSYSWSGPSGYTSTVQNPTLSNASFAMGGTYSLNVSASGCTAPQVTVAVSIAASPGALTVTPASASLCAGSSQTIGVTGGTSSPTLNAGTNTNLNLYSTFPSPYSLWYGGQRFQFMVLASELSATGFAANSQINNLVLPVTTFSSNWGVSLFDVQGFKVSIGATTATALTAFQSTLTTVYGPSNFTPTTGYNNVHNFSPAFVWDGVSNLVIETAFSNAIGGTSSDAVFTYTTATSFPSSVIYYADNTAAATIYTTTTVNLSYSARPDFKLNGLTLGTFSWSPSNDLSAATGASVTSTPTVTKVYTVSTQLGACTSSATASIGVANAPSVSLVSTGSLLCGGASATITANGSNTYSWNTGATTSSIVISPTSTTTYSLVGTSAPCPGSAAGSITIAAGPNPALNITGSSGICTGQTATLIASGANTYSWNTGSTSNSITSSPGSNTTYTVVGTSSVGCTTTTTQLVTVAASLSITISGSSSVCLGQSVSLSGQGGVTYTWNTGATTSTIAPSPSVNTTYSVIGASGTCSNTATKLITVNANPTITVSGNTSICAGQSTTLTAGGASTYTWLPSTVASSLVVAPLANTVYTVNGTSAAGCTASVTSAITSNSVPVIAVSQSAGSVCVNSPATFTASGASTYTWSTVSNNTVISITPTASASYTVSGTNPAGCVSSQSFSLVTNPVPVLIISPASATVCSASQVSFLANGASTYTWNGTVVSSSVAFNPTANAVYSVTGASSLGCVASTTVGVTTNSVPVLSINPSSITVCAYSPASFTASGAASYTWNGTTPGSTITLLPPASTINTVVGVNAAGCSAQATVAVVAVPLPTVAVSPSITTVCALTTTTFTASGANTYSWSTGATTSSASVNPSVSGTYSVTGTNSLGCSSSAIVIVITNTLPPISISPASATVCALDPVSLSASGATSYTWTGGPVSATTIVTPSVSTTYSVNGLDVNGCIGTQTILVSALALPVISIAPANLSVCANSSSTITASGASTYTWLTTASNDPTLAITPSASSVYSVSGTNTLGCTNTGTISVFAYTLPNILASPAQQTICVGETAIVSASGGTSYTVTPAGSSSGSVFSLTPVTLSQYTLSGSDANCTNTTVITVFVNACTGLQTQTTHADLISVFPNPSSGLLTATLEFDGLKEIKVLNAIGQVIELRVTENQLEHFNLSEYAKGIYYISVNSKQASGNFRIVIQ